MRGGLRRLPAVAILGVAGLLAAPAVAQSGSEDAPVVEPAEVLERVRADRKA